MRLQLKPFAIYIKPAFNPW